MTWYLVKKLMASSIDELPDRPPLFDESLMLVKANSRQEAEVKAKKLCLKHYEVEYQNGDGENVSWKFVKIVEVLDLDKKSLRDGVLIQSRLF